ncbi:tRNA uridine-5-carboxymethylaminomethyl(34) synthesis GTPase MnmE [Sandaracinobacteroides hominis]|uniref:tRNA uridine-5-carboxymethylaminomethyl(34) synthesis GTPase MnmE n=1 Tax=Sandaracinobacteroides hominis TaxID=2780086 RepID=UPI0018F57747|nr:tRNA uridine-5-carboxymethylaminomethyl(34) synthesis GTPase MnmE [Sandaracinobacteroides hominis]
MSRTIFALSSGPPPSGVAVIRLSGPESLEIVRQLTGARLPAPREARLRNLHRPSDGQLLDSALVLTFPGPSSFTGEDSAELHCHGSPSVVAGVQQALAELGAHPAEAGEFTRRAFETGRLDLTQAEALSDLIAAETEAQRDQALSGAGGRLRHRADLWREQLIGLMALSEAELDFADEGDVGEISPSVRAGMSGLAAHMAAALATAPLAERIRSGLTIAIVGPPNAGKSSLLNALARRDVAIVTPHAGTTRDVLEVHLDLAGRPAVLLDTAGLRETTDPIEAEGIARARARADSADLVLNLGPGGNLVNKIDESGDRPGWRDGKLYLSAQTGAGLPELESWLADWAQAQIPKGEAAVVTTARQQALVAEALARVEEAAAQQDPVLTAESLRSAAHALGRLTGQIDPEAILGAIFLRFCIGK